ncbi:MAG: tetratricopeptide repeat protein [Acidobacteria bacterium]|nr:tetratricopeptide repeat protein [Acidobacteriota bacterium]
MFSFFHDRKEYGRLKDHLIAKANLLCQEMNLPGDRILIQHFKEAHLSVMDGMISGTRRTDIRTPMQLKPLLEAILAYPPALSAWLVLYQVRAAIMASGLSIGIQGDIMMAFEAVNYVIPEMANQGADHLAHALCMMPSLGRARSTFHHLGLPYSDKFVTKSEMEALMRQGFLPQDAKIKSEAATALGWNMGMRKLVADAIERIGSTPSKLLCVDKFRNAKLMPLARWPHPLNETAVELLDKGINLAGQRNFDDAWRCLTEAAELEPLLLPDALRNKDWILSKQKRYEEGVELCRQALKIDPEYAEIWYAMGIDLAKLGRYEEALQAYQKAKALGFRSGGLEHNIDVCKRNLRGY